MFFSSYLVIVLLVELFFFFPLCLQKSFSFTVRDSLVNVGPLKDFSYGLRINADPNATGIAKQSNYELVSYIYYALILLLRLDVE